MNIDIEERVQKAVALFKKGYNCSQSVFLAYNDILGIEDTLAATLSAPLGGGMGRLREVCGAVSASFIIIGFKYPSNNPEDKVAKTRNYVAVQELAAEFRAKNGSIVCRKLLGLDHKQDAPEPSDRTEAYYKRRPCADYVATAARLVGERLNSKE